MGVESSICRGSKVRKKVTFGDPTEAIVARVKCMKNSYEFEYTHNAKVIS